MRRLTFLLTSVLILGGLPICFSASQDPIELNNRQREFVDQTFQEIERERLLREARRQADEKRRALSKKKRQEARLAAQFAGLSGRLSGLPELPSFDGNVDFSGTGKSAEKKEKS